MSNNNKIERRAIVADAAIAGSDDSSNGRLISGYASVFNSGSELIFGSFYEYIEKGAFDGVIEQSDVLALLNHDESRGVLARSRYGSGTLTLSIDDKGLRYEFEAPNTQLGDELIEGIKRGDIFGSSFSFEVEEDSWDYSGEHAVRTIKKISRIYDVSPVYTPAYNATVVDARSLAKAQSNATNERDGKMGNYYKHKFF